MAWRSSGSNNAEMVENLKRFGVIQSRIVEDSFLAVDRRLFVPPEWTRMAHADRPIREGYLHISAPHIYGNVMEAFDLDETQNRHATFLNIGSGTGYLTCLVSHALGTHSTSYSVEIRPEALEHAKQATAAWQETDPERMIFIEGNGLSLDANQGEGVTGFDRIYVGAAMEREDLPQMAELLRPNGILVGPVGDELVKVVRISRADTASVAIPRSFRGRAPLLSADFNTQVLSGVRFSTLVEPSPRAEPLVIPSRVWDPSLNRFYPKQFQKGAEVLMLCANSPALQKVAENGQGVAINVASYIPRALWLEVLSYANRDWFETPLTEEEMLRQRMQQMEAALKREQEARNELENQLRIVERERDNYHQMTRFLQARMGWTFANESANDAIFGRTLLAMLREDTTDDEEEEEEDATEEMEDYSSEGDTEEMDPEEDALDTSTLTTVSSKRAVSIGDALP